MRWTVYISLTLLLLSCGRKTNETSPVRKDITETVFATGTLEPEGRYNLTAQTEGYIRELRISEGDNLAEGGIAAIIDNPSSEYSAESAEALYRIASMNASEEGPAITQAKQNAALLRTKVQQDSVQLQRYDKLLKASSVSKLEYENARLAYENSRTAWLNAVQSLELARQQSRQQLVAQKAQRDISGVSGQYNTLRAVKAGKVYRLMKEAGDYVRRGEIIAVLGHPQRMYAKLNVDEDNIARVVPGQKVIVQVNTVKDTTFEGKITEIYPAFDEQSQSFICRADLDLPARLKISGTQLQANIIIRVNRHALVIPRAFIDFGNNVNVKDKGRVKVKPGFISGEWVEIREGLDESSVITTDQLK
jgi:HlyD family secretion protein